MTQIRKLTSNNVSWRLVFKWQNNTNRVRCIRNSRGRWNKLIRNFRGNKAWNSRVTEFVIACEQTLPFQFRERSKPRENARANGKPSCPPPAFAFPVACLSRVDPLFTISPYGEFARRLSLSGYFSREKSYLRRSHSLEYFESQNSHDRASSVCQPKNWARS